MGFIVLIELTWKSLGKKINDTKLHQKTWAEKRFLEWNLQRNPRSGSFWVFCTKEGTTLSLLIAPDPDMWSCRGFGPPDILYCGPWGFPEITEEELLSVGFSCLSTETVTQPSLKVTNTTVSESSFGVFTCHSGNPVKSTLWMFNNQSLQLTKRMTLSQKNSHLSIDPVKMEDAGDYQCEVYNPVSSKKSLPVLLEVNSEWLLSSYIRDMEFFTSRVQNSKNYVRKISV